MRCSAARLSSAAWRRAASDSVPVDVRSCSAWSVASWAWVEAAFEQPLGVRAGAAQQLLGLGAGRLGLGLQPLAGLVGDPLGLGAGGGQRLLGLGAGLVQQPAGLRLGAGAQLLGPARRSR